MDFLGPAGDGRGFFIFFPPAAAGDAPCEEGRGVMWEYFWPDLAFDVVKGLIAGGASLVTRNQRPLRLPALRFVA
jgi:hypothetical protein